MKWLLVFIPIALGLRFASADPMWVFFASALAVMPLSEIMGEATEVIAEVLGPRLGSLLNASLNNAPEIIIAGFALKNGLVDVVKASLTGSILGNLLFGLGLAMVVGGLRHGALKFDEHFAKTQAALLTLAVFGLVVPAVFHTATETLRLEISKEIALVLLFVYVAGLVETFRKPKTASTTTIPGASTRDKQEHGKSVGPAWLTWKVAIALLAADTLVLAVMSEVMTDALEPTATRLGLSPVFAGIILLSLVSNIPQFSNAIGFAKENKMDLAIGVTVGASTQVALLVGPILVLLSPLLGHQMDLLFRHVEVVSALLAVYVARNLTVDGQGSWLEGVVLVALYLMIGFGFYSLAS